MTAEEETTLTYRERLKAPGICIMQHVESGAYLIMVPGVVLFWAPSVWWHVGLVRFLRWEFRP